MKNQPTSREKSSRQLLDDPLQYEPVPDLPEILKHSHKGMRCFELPVTPTAAALGWKKLELRIPQTNLPSRKRPMNHGVKGNIRKAAIREALALGTSIALWFPYHWSDEDVYVGVWFWIAVSASVGGVLVLITEIQYALKRKLRSDR